MDWLLLAVLAVAGLTAAALVLILLPVSTVDTIDTPVGEADEDPDAAPRTAGAGSDEGRSDEQWEGLDAGRQARPGDDR